MGQNCWLCGEYIPGKRPNQKYCKKCRSLAKEIQNRIYDLRKILSRHKN